MIPPRDSIPYSLLESRLQNTLGLMLGSSDEASRVMKLPGVRNLFRNVFGDTQRLGRETVSPADFKRFIDEFNGVLKKAGVDPVLRRSLTRTITVSGNAKSLQTAVENVINKSSLDQQKRLMDGFRVVDDVRSPAVQEATRQGRRVREATRIDPERGIILRDPNLPPPPGPPNLQPISEIAADDRPRRRSRKPGPNQGQKRVGSNSPLPKTEAFRATLPGREPPKRKTRPTRSRGNRSFEMSGVNIPKRARARKAAQAAQAARAAAEAAAAASAKTAGKAAAGTAAKTAAKLAARAGSGALVGSATGPIGTIVGGALGLLTAYELADLFGIIPEREDRSVNTDQIRQAELAGLLQGPSTNQQLERLNEGFSREADIAQSAFEAQRSLAQNADMRDAVMTAILAPNRGQLGRMAYREGPSFDEILLGMKE